MQKIADLLDFGIVETDKQSLLPLLLIGDESEYMIARYLDRGTLYAANIGSEPVAVCLTTDEGDNVVEVKNLAVLPQYQRKGIGRAMLEYIERLNSGKTIILGTGETPSTLSFYQACGYTYSHRIPNFFTDNYDHPIIEDGIMLKDMVYLCKKIGKD